jgi:hypothetical protein
MIKLNKVISQLNKNTFDIIEHKLTQTKAENFLYLFREYKIGKSSEEDIMSNLKINHNSLYVLKSRLYDRIQEHLTINVNPSKNDIYHQLGQINNMCYESSYDIALAYLLKLEKDLQAHDMHVELHIVYRALKKIHYNTNKYYHYSQLHNKHISFWLSVEKVNDILFDFNLLLEEYDLSKSGEHIVKLNFLKKEIDNHFDLNPSKQIEIIKNISEIQLYVFCKITINSDKDIDDLLTETIYLINQLSETSYQKKWILAIHYLAYEYYKMIGKTIRSNEYYEKTNLYIYNLLLYSNVSLVAKFLVSKINYLSQKNQSQLLHEEKGIEILFNDTMYSKIHLGLYNAMVSYHSNDIKKSINILNDLLNQFSFKNYLHICMEIKFTLAFMYMKLNNFEMAESIVRSIYKKIQTDKLLHYANAIALVKFFLLKFKQKKTSVSNEKQEGLLFLFFARNQDKHLLLSHLQSELKTIIN